MYAHYLSFFVTFYTEGPKIHESQINASWGPDCHLFIKTIDYRINSCIFCFYKFVFQDMRDSFIENPN